MSRSLKKGPYVEPKLLQKIEEMNRTGTKRVIRTWSRASVIFRRWLAIPWPSMMGVVMYRSTSRRTW